MNIADAIDILETMHDTYLLGFESLEQIALKLAINALRRLQDNRRDPEYDHWTPLPGEWPPPDPSQT